MSGDTIDVSPESLEEHATAVRNFMGEISGATADAGQTFDFNAFGYACIVPAQLLQVWIRDADSFIKKAVTAGNEVADSLMEMAESYRQNEQAQSAAFGSIHKSLDGGS